LKLNKKQAAFLGCILRHHTWLQGDGMSLPWWLSGAWTVEGNRQSGAVGRQDRKNE
jgi:hypothetical protein